MYEKETLLCYMDLLTGRVWDFSSIVYEREHWIGSSSRSRKVNGSRLRGLRQQSGLLKRPLKCLYGRGQVRFCLRLKIGK